MKLATVIMAAGKGKRMKNPDKSKVMFELKGKPMIEYVINLSLEIHSELIVPIVGHKKNTVIDYIQKKFKFEINKIKFAHQDEQLGTGHAIMQTEKILKDFHGNVLILSGDVPLLKYNTISEFLDYHEANGFSASLLSAVFEDPFGYGRIIRDERGKFLEIVEEKDATDEQRKIKEINSGIYLIDSSVLFEALENLETNNAQGEYYLTDVFSYFKKRHLNIGALPVKNNLEITGVNTIEQLYKLEKLMN